VCLYIAAGTSVLEVLYKILKNIKSEAALGNRLLMVLGKERCVRENGLFIFKPFIRNAQLNLMIDIYEIK
jgi:hypothetical protein